MGPTKHDPIHTARTDRRTRTVSDVPGSSVGPALEGSSVVKASILFQNTTLKRTFCKRKVRAIVSNDPLAKTDIQKHKPIHLFLFEKSARMHNLTKTAVA